MGTELVEGRGRRQGVKEEGKNEKAMWSETGSDVVRD